MRRQPTCSERSKEKIEQSYGWEGEDDRTDELEEWKLYQELGTEEKQMREAFVAIDRLRMTRHIAKTKLEIENKEVKEESVKDEMDEVMRLIWDRQNRKSRQIDQDEKPESWKWRAKTIEQYNAYHANKPLTGSRFNWKRHTIK